MDTSIGRLTRFALLLGTLAMLGSGRDISAAELRGQIVEVTGTDVRIRVEGDLSPQVGDSVRITFRLPGGSEPTVGTWRVTRVEGDIVLASVVEATGKPAPGQTATITSGSPTSRQSAASTSPGPGGRPWLGVVLGPLTEELSRELGLAVGRGAVVIEIAPGSPAEQGGLVARDVVVGYEGVPVQGPAALQKMVAASRPGASVALTVWRAGAERTVRLTLGSRPEGR